MEQPEASTGAVVLLEPSEKYMLGQTTPAPLFQMAWLGEVPALPVFGDGTNCIPAIHVVDLAG